MERLTNDLANSERETHISMTADNRDEWIIFTDDPVMANRFDKFAEFIEEKDSGRHYRMRRNQITIGKGYKKKDLTDEERKILSDRAKNNFHNSKGGSEG